MKTKRILLSLLTLSVSIGMKAYSFKVNGIYYDITSSTNKTVGVTYQNSVRAYDPSNIPSGFYYDTEDIGGDEDYFWVYDYYTYDYSGCVSIPTTVTYNGTTYSVTSIQAYAFNNITVTSLTIPASITSIGENVFRGYKGTLTVNCNLPNNSIFHDSSIRAVTFGNSVTSIGDYAFYGLSSISTITLSNSITRIGNHAFRNCTGLNTIATPSSIISIGAYAFSGCSNLAVIDINATSLTSIGSDAFLGCTKLKTVNLNSIANWLNCSLANANSSPFCNGADLYVADEEKTTISFPVTTTQIPAYAFYGCRNLTSVTIPSQVTTIGTQAFGNCPSLTAININSNNSNYSSEDGILYNANKTALISCLTTKSGAVTIPLSVTSISASAFSGCSGITSLTLPSSLTSIGNNAFQNCSGITSVTVPNTLSTTVGTNAFSGCSGIAIVNTKISDISSISSNRTISFLPASATWNYYLNDNLVTTLDIPSNVISIGNNAFYNAKGITSITFPSSLTSIGSSAFYKCTGITTLTLPGSLTSIGSSAFSGCTGIISITLPSSLTSIGGSAFYGCTGITTLTLPGSLTSIGSSAFSGCTGIISITLPSSLTSIGNSAFSGCSGITSLSLPSSLTSIGSSAFSGCTGALTVNCKIPNASSSSSSPFNGSSFSSVTFGNGVTSIGDYAFYNRSSITSLTLPSSLTSIGNSAFYYCSGITSLTLPSSLTSIGYNAFYGCKGALTVNCNIPNASSASGSPFYGSSFSSVTFGDGVTSIGNYAFYNKSSISSITLPSSLTSIGSYAFSGCTPTAFICKAATPPTLGSNNSFGGQKKIYVPYKSMDAYKSAWSQLSTPTYTYLPLLDVMFFETQSAASYASELTNKDKSKITSVAFYEGGLGNDLTESVMKAGMNPNCLYYVPASAGLSGDNIVTLDSYLAESVTLTDNYTYDCPIPFHTEEIKYVHNPSVWANGSAGWETICLPFAPETFEASEQGFISPIMLGSNGNFWLRKFVGASSDAVYFASTIDGQMEANTPYLVAFPGSTMGAGHLQGQTITFTGYDANIQVTEQPTVRNNDFVFVGNYDKEADGIEGWALNAAGSSFARSTSVGNQPFRAYFKNLSGQASNARLRIDFSDPTDVRSLRTASSDISLAAIGNGELIIQSKSNRPLSIYTVDGRLVRRVQLAIGENRIDGLHKGLYIVDNHKIMMR